MTFQLANVVPWGRSFEEYISMFALSEQDLHKSILGCADGPASFNCELTERGGSIISVDPLYEYGGQQIKQRIDETFNEIMKQTRENMNEFIWTNISSVEELGRVRMEAMAKFLFDYDRGRSEGRYRPQSLPSLSFSDDQFQMALCSHFLFLYSDHLDLEFHIRSIREMCRVSCEARIFPLTKLGASISPHLQAVVDHFEDEGYEVDIARVPYEFQRGGNQMLRIRKT
ncbi:MAG TPA: hypothetical protein VN455_00415 [Methanotrichaceae archaeon]|nr:hypothetical protein [Methanotrichaceae archaeon]